MLDSLQDIDDLLVTYGALFDSVKQKEPDVVELAALGTVLHSFYNGIEGVFLLVAKQIDKDVPSVPTWHQALLSQMVLSTEERMCVVSLEAATALASYMKFRHFFRHAYSFMLDWGRLAPLVEELHSVWATVRSEINVFIDSLEADASSTL